jgi:hypothetical protein
MGAEKIHQGDVGTVIELLILQAGTNTPEDVSDATTITVRVETKGGTVTEHVGSFVTDGADGLIKFTSVAGTFGVAGEAKIQGYLENAGGTKKHHTTEYTVVVHDVIA